MIGKHDLWGISHDHVCYISMQHSKPSHVRPNCAACRREAPASILQPAQSRLDFQTRYLCPACIEHQAEALPALISMVNTTGWKELSDEVRRIIRVWDADGYVTIPDWAERMNRRQLTIVQEAKDLPHDPEEEAILQRLLKKRQELLASQSQASRPSKRRTRLSKRFQRMKTLLARSNKGSQAKAAGQAR